VKRLLSLPLFIGAAVLALLGVLLFRRRRPAPPERQVVDRAPFPWGDLGPSERVMVLGVSGTGKTFWVKKLLTGGATPSSKPAERVLYGDPQGDYGDVAEPITLAELRELADELAGGERFALAVQLEGAGDDDDGDEEALAAQVEELIGLARRIGGCVLVLDEVGDYADHARKALSKLARNGRHDRIAAVFVSQAAVEIPKGARRQATRVYSFLQTDPADLKALERFGASFTARVTAWVKGSPPATWVLPSLSELPSC
jgi:hypothetical protein